MCTHIYRLTEAYVYNQLNHIHIYIYKYIYIYIYNYIYIYKLYIIIYIYRLCRTYKIISPFNIITRVLVYFKKFFLPKFIFKYFTSFVQISFIRIFTIFLFTITFEISRKFRPRLIINVDVVSLGTGGERRADCGSDGSLEKVNSAKVKPGY